MGDARAFLGMYQQMTGAGLRAGQLDRAPALQSAGAELAPDTIAQVQV